MRDAEEGRNGSARQPNGLDHLSFVLQLVQIAPMTISLFGLFLSSVWALRLAVTVTLVVAWATSRVLSHERSGPRARGHTGRRKRGPADE